MYTACDVTSAMTLFDFGWVFVAAHVYVRATTGWV